MSPFSVQANASVAPPTFTEETLNSHILPYGSGLYATNTVFPDPYHNACSSTASLVNIFPSNYKNMPLELLEVGKDPQSLLLAPHLIAASTELVAESAQSVLMNPYQAVSSNNTQISPNTSTVLSATALPPSYSDPTAAALIANPASYNLAMEHPQLYGFSAASADINQYYWPNGLPNSIPNPYPGALPSMQGFPSNLHMPNGEEISPIYPTISADALNKYENCVTDPNAMRYVQQGLPPYSYLTTDDKLAAPDALSGRMPFPGMQSYPNGMPTGEEISPITADALNKYENCVINPNAMRYVQSGMPPYSYLGLPIEAGFQAASGSVPIPPNNIYGSTSALNVIPPEVSTATPLTLATNNELPRYPSPQLNSSGSSYLPPTSQGPLSAGSNVPSSANPRTRARRSRSTVKDSEDDDCRSNEDKEQERRYVTGQLAARIRRQTL